MDGPRFPPSEPLCSLRHSLLHPQACLVRGSQSALYLHKKSQYRQCYDIMRSVSKPIALHIIIVYELLDVPCDLHVVPEAGLVTKTCAEEAPQPILYCNRSKPVVYFLSTFSFLTSPGVQILINGERISFGRAILTCICCGATLKQRAYASCSNSSSMSDRLYG